MFQSLSCSPNNSVSGACCAFEVIIGVVPFGPLTSSVTCVMNDFRMCAGSLVAQVRLGHATEELSLVAQMQSSSTPAKFSRRVRDRRLSRQRVRFSGCLLCRWHLRQLDKSDR